MAAADDTEYCLPTVDPFTARHLSVHIVAGDV